MQKKMFERFTAVRLDLEQRCGGVGFASIGKLFRKSFLSYVLGQHSDSPEVENALRLSSEGAFKIIYRVVSDKANVSPALLWIHHLKTYYFQHCVKRALPTGLGGSDIDHLVFDGVFLAEKRDIYSRNTNHVR